MHKVLTVCATALALLGAPAAQCASPPAHPLLAEWAGPYGGVPPFDKVRLALFKPAIEAGMAQQRREIAAICNNPAPPTFDNTVLAIERSGRALGRVSRLFWLWSGSLSTPPFQRLERELGPRFAAFGDEFNQNVALFRRVEAVYRSPEMATLNPEQQRLVWSYYTGFVKHGATLDAAQKKRVAAINQRLALLGTQFSQNMMADEERALVITSAAELAGLSPAEIDAAAAHAKTMKLRGQWAIANTRSSMEPFITHATRRDLREKGWRLWIMRGDNGDAHDNNRIVTETLLLRAERSRLMSFPSYAHWQLTDSMAGDPQKAMDLMLQVWRPAVQRLREQVAQMQALVDAERGGFKIQPWDFRYYAEKLRAASYNFDSAELTPYLQLDNIREAMFWAAGRLYGLRFERITDVPVFHPDMSTYKVLGADGQLVGLWYFDPYARAGKSSGAWMNSYRLQQRLAGDITPIVSNNSNFTHGKPGEPEFISWDDAVTMFHEFGHALHGLMSNVTYPSLASPNTLSDFGEFPSQLNEHWLPTPEVLSRLVDTAGRPLPPELVAKVRRAKVFDEPFAATEFLASAIVDMKLHLISGTPVDPRAFEKAALAELGMPPEIVMRHRIPQFGHIFSSENYAAGYYNYQWAAVLEHDAFAAFTEAGDVFDPAWAKRLRDTIYAVGNTIDPAQAFRNFRGRDPQVEALLRANGFLPTAAPAAPASAAGN